MKPAKFIAEHKKLVKVLAKGSPKQRKDESKEQATELKRFCKKEGIKCSL